MKRITIIIALFCVNLVFGQTVTESVKLAEGRFGFDEWEIVKQTSKGKSMTVFYLAFNNKEYEYITDIGMFSFYKQSELKAFVSALETLKDKEKGVQVSIDLKTGGKIVLYDFANEIYLYDEDGKYTTISKGLADDFCTIIPKHYELLAP